MAWPSMKWLNEWTDEMALKWIETRCNNMTCRDTKFNQMKWCDMKASEWNEMDIICSTNSFTLTACSG